MQPAKVVSYICYVFTAVSSRSPGFMLCWKNQLDAVSWRSVSTCAVNHYNLPCSCSTSKLKANVTFQPQTEGLWEQGGAGGGIFHCNTFFLSCTDVRNHNPQLGGAYGSPQGAVQVPYSCFEVFKGGLHLSSLRLVILIITNHFPFWVKVVPICWVQQACLGGVLALCAISP